MLSNRKSSDSHQEASGRVIVGVHGSQSSLRALRHAVEIALDRAWELEIITVWPDADDPLIHGVPGRYIAARGHAMECQQQALAAVDPLVAPGAETFLFNARPAQALISRCRDADLLVVGAGRPAEERGRRSVGAECVEEAPCAVTVVPYPHANLAQDPETDEPPRHQQRTGRRRAPRAGAAGPAPSGVASVPDVYRPAPNRLSPLLVARPRCEPEVGKRSTS
jgi:nucleotide-binding universal stress UspA family protein